MKINNNNSKVRLPLRGDVRKTILSSLGKKGIKRKTLIQRVLNKSGYTKAQLKDTSSDSLSTRLKSFTGIVINEMIAEKALILTDDFEILAPEVKIPTDKQIIDIFLNKYLTEEEIKNTAPGAKRNQIQAALGIIFKNERRQIREALDVMAYIDLALRRNESVNNIIKEREKCYPKTLLGNQLKSINKKFFDCKRGVIKKGAYLKELHDTAMYCISLAGGEFFERFCMQLVKRCYGNKVVRDELTAGPRDKGIDGIVIIKDDLGFEEKILIQCKTKRKRKRYIPESETRAFLGVMTSEGATKGLMMSNSNYLQATVRFAKRVSNLMLIDQKRLAELMEKYQIGFIKTNGLLKIDEEVFLE